MKDINQKINESKYAYFWQKACVMALAEIAETNKERAIEIIDSNFSSWEEKHEISNY